MSDDRCTCPPIRDVFRHGVGTRHPCPIHPEPVFLPGTFVPLADVSDAKFNTDPLPMPDDRPESPEERKIDTIREGMRHQGYGYAAIERAVAALSTPAGPSPEPWTDPAFFPHLNHPVEREEAVEAEANVLDAARRVTAMLDGEPGEWTLDGVKVTEDAAAELLSLHGYLNDVSALSAARPSSPTPEETPEVERRLRASLERFGRHGGDCQAAYAAVRCTCGYHAALNWFPTPGDDATTKEGR